MNFNRSMTGDMQNLGSDITTKIICV